jgi:mannosylglycoprotein endo-beta-mannosidase
VCKAKKDGGLGVRDIRIVNVSLLTKWRWKLLQCEPTLWKEVIVAKYGADSLSNVIYNGIPGARIASSWWKDICALEDFVVSKKWLSEVIARRVNNGVSTSFCSHMWLGELSLAEAFPRLFSLSVQKEASIAELVDVTGEEIGWNFMWRRSLFSWEEDLLHRLQQSLVLTRLSMDADLWFWKPVSDGVFIVKSTYSLLFQEAYSEVEIGENVNRVFQQLWKSPAPSKLIAFSWQLIHNRIPTRDNLARRSIIRGDDSRVCVLCSNVGESSSHLFLHCDVAYGVWAAIFRWLGIIIIMPPSLPIMFEYLSSFAKNKKVRNGFRLVWHTTLWLIWKGRNDVIFNNSVKTASDCVEENKVLTWKWSVHKLKISPCLYYEWIWDPGICFIQFFLLLAL